MQQDKALDHGSVDRLSTHCYSYQESTGSGHLEHVQHGACLRAVNECTFGVLTDLIFFNSGAYVQMLAIYRTC